jgi:hypothetical protein
MNPELPPTFIIGDPNRVQLGVIPQDDMECGMLRLGMQCSNTTREALLYPMAGHYGMLPICEMCLGEWRFGDAE